MLNTIEEFLKTDQAKKMGFLHITDVVTDAARQLLKSYGYYPTSKTRFVHFNVYEDHVTLMDNELNRLVDVYFRGDKAYCEYDEAFDCEHIKSIMELPKVMNTLQEKGWIVEDGKIIKGPV